MGYVRIKLEHFLVELENNLSFLKQSKALTEHNFQSIKQETLNQIIYKELIQLMSQKTKIFVAPSELEKYIFSIKKQYGNNKSFQDYLSEKKIDESQWKKDISFTLLEKKIIQSLDDQVPGALEKDVKSYYEKNKLKMKTKKSFEVAIFNFKNKEQAQKALDALQNGYSTSYIIKKFSPLNKGPEKINLHDLKNTPWLQLHDKSPGALTPVIKSKNGFQIARLTGIKKPRVKAFNELKSEIKALLIAEKNINYLSLMKNKLNVNVNINNLIYKNIKYND